MIDVVVPDSPARARQLELPFVAADREAGAIRESLLDGAVPPRNGTGTFRLAQSVLTVPWRSVRFLEALRRSRRFARGNQSVLVSGESGAGKTSFSEILHVLGPRPHEPFVVVNCAALPQGLLESELFGHVRGAFTGAHADRAGLLRAAAAGTVFLDEIDKAAPAAQAALLHVLDRHEARPVGGSNTYRIRARLVFATNRRLHELAERGDLLPDLAFRIGGLRVHVPPLRDRLEDLDLLLALALRDVRVTEGWGDLSVSTGARELLAARDWPGNVRELFRTVQAAAHLREGSVLRARDVERAIGAGARAVAGFDLPGRLRAFERREILRALRLEQGDQARAARRLGLSRRGLNKKLHRHGLLDQLRQEALPAFRCRRAR